MRKADLGLFALLLLGLLLVTSGSVRAEEEPTPTMSEAERAARAALDLHERELGPDAKEVADDLGTLATVLADEGRFPEARPLLERALAIDREQRGATHLTTAGRMVQTAFVLRCLGEYEESETLYRQATAIRLEALGEDHPQVGECHFGLGTVAYYRGRYAEAGRLLGRARHIFESKLGPMHVHLNPILALQARVLTTTGRPGEARPLVERGLAICQASLGPDHPDVATAHVDVAVVLGSLGEFEAACEHYERALAIYEKALGPDHPWVAAALDGLASSLDSMGRYRAARVLLERSLPIWERAFGPRHPDVAICLGHLASTWANLGQFADAVRCQERALAIEEAVLGPGHPRVGATLAGLGNLLHSMGAYDRAATYFTKAVEIQKAAYGADHPALARSLSGLAVVEASTGRYEAALRLQESALERCEAVYGPEHPNVAACLQNVAAVHMDLGRVEAARPLSARALAILEHAHGQEHSEVATALFNHAHVLQQLGQRASAMRLLERALRVYEQTLGASHPSVAGTLRVLASLRVDEGRCEEAHALLERALAIHERSLGPDHYMTALDRHDLGLCLLKMGEFEDAVAHFEHATRICEAAFGGEHERVGACLANLARAHGMTGQPEKALAVAERAISIHINALGREHPTVAKLLNLLADLHHDLGNLDRAREFLSDALQIMEPITRRAFGALPSRGRILAKDTTRYMLDNWCILASELGISGYGEAFRFKGLVVRMATAERRARRRGGDEVGGLLSELARAEARVANLANAMPPMFRREAHAAWQEAYASAAGERTRLEERTQDLGTRRAAGPGGAEPGVRDVQRQLDAGEVLIDFLRTRDRYVAWVLGRQGDASRVELGPAEAIEEAATRFAEQAADREDGDREASGRRLCELVWAPLEESMGEDVVTVFLCPDAALATIPFAALPGREEGRLLMDDCLVVNVSMAQDLVPWGEAGKSGKGAVLVGDVDYGHASDGEGETARASPRRLARVDRAPRGDSFGPLSATRGEVRSIGLHLGPDSVLLLGADATESRFRAAAKGRRVLHVATHGFVRDDLMRGLTRRSTQDDAWLGAAAEERLAQGYDPMLLAGLALAGANPREGGHEDDGILSAAEASHLDLDGVDLVVLSACQTALGRKESGEGVVGLVQAFRMAGAKRVLGSLWRVDDEATRALMVKFYELWNPPGEEPGLGAAAALRRAQEFVSGHEKWNHPYYWAAWVLWGLPE